MLFSSYIALSGMVLLSLVDTASCRISAQSMYIPACYIDTSVWGSNQLYRCNNPLYETCSVISTSKRLCCGPDHYCCESGCCRNESLNAYEMTAIVTGIAAWVGILIVLGICLVPKPIRAIRRKLRQMKKGSKISPSD